MKYAIMYIQSATLWFWAGSGCSNQTGAIVAIIGGIIYVTWIAILYLLRRSNEY